MCKNDSSFPIILGRRGGSKFSIITDSNNAILYDNVLVSIQNKKKLNLIKQNLLSYIHDIIGIETDSQERNKLLNLKRRIFNDKDYAECSFIKNKHPEIKKLCNYYYSLQTKHIEDIDRKKSIFFKTLYHSIFKLKETTQNYFFANGLLFASNVLFEQIEKKSFNYNSLNKKDKKIVISVLKYLSRSLVKTTPFSSFNNLFSLQLNNGDYQSLNYGIQQSNIEITNVFFHKLKTFLLTESIFKNHLIIHINSTIEDTDTNNKFHFFNNNKNTETFSKLDKSEILETIIENLKNKQLIYLELVNILTDVTGEPRITVIKYVDKLIEFGFLHLEYPVIFERKNWVNDLNIFLLKHNKLISNYKNLSNLLVNIKKTICRLEETADVNRKKQIIHNSYLEICNYFVSRQKNILFNEIVKAQDLYYEQTFVKTEEKISKTKVDKISLDLNKVFHNLNNIPFKLAFKKFLGTELLEKHSGKLPILEFYQKIYLNNLDHSILKEKDLLTFKLNIRKIALEISECSNLECIDLSLFTEDIYNVSDIDNIPFGAFIQVSNNDWDTIVLNSFSKGFGSNISRFLNCMPASATELISDYIANKKTIVADIKDASISNLNNYPPLTRELFDIAQNYTSKNHYKEINLLESYIVSDLKKGIILLTKDGKEITPNIFSLEAPSRKSKFSNFLDFLNPIDNTGFQMYKDRINNIYKENILEKELIVIPRLTYTDKVIIQRKTWLVKKNILINLIDKTIYDLEESYHNINEWIYKKNIPNNVFITTEKRIDSKLTDNYKPQYIDFTSPLYIMLLTNLLYSADDIIQISEMYPSAKEIIADDGYVKEYVLNLN